VPTRSELIQYERRFVELYSQVAWKHDETKKYYALYNTLNSKADFLQTELNLLNSMSDNFEVAMANPQTQSEFIDQCELSLRGVAQTLERQQQTLALKSQRVGTLKSAHEALVDQQHKYFRAIKDFQSECEANDKLTELSNKQ
jgi:hypothetical protein